MFDVLIIGGGAAGMSCALVIGSALEKSFANTKKVGLIAHQKTSHLQNALFNNALGLAPKTLGEDILKEGLTQLKTLYPKVSCINHEKTLELKQTKDGFKIITNKNSYTALIVVVTTGYSKP